MIEIIGWVANVLAIVGWLLNISVERRLYAMIVFTVATILSVVYFSYNFQPSFLLRMVFYLGVDIVTIWHILVKEKNNA